ncbi:MAG TPA: hypothetical protein VMR74_04755 [Gammaproteobacteria bacterium]|nr:hypothetical protein [Gammaproteobacteria bacterium]
MSVRTCPTCELDKPVGDFLKRPHPHGPDQCRSCRRAARRRWEAEAAAMAREREPFNEHDIPLLADDLPVDWDVDL